MLETLLKGSGYEVVSAKNGVEALEKLKKDFFEMIISDILMPKMDGFQLCRECKSDDTLRKIPFVFYTATYTDKKDEEFALSLGAEKFIIKPADPDVFLSILEGVIKEYQERALVAPKKPIEKEEVYLAEYNKRLIQKLEKKMLDLEKAHKELEESEQKYRELIDNANDAVIVIEPPGFLSFINPKFCETTGYTTEEAKKLHFSKLVHPDDLAMVTENFRKRLSGAEVPRHYEFRVLTKLGETIYVDYNASLIERDGETVGIQAVIRDVTERKRAEKRIEHLNSVLNAIKNVNQLIMVEKDRDTLLQKACDTLIEARGYDAAWLGFLRDENRFATVKGSGFREDVVLFCEHVMGGDLPPCIRNALARKNLFLLVDKSRDCEDCFFKSACVGKDAAIIRVEHADRLFGLLAISLAPDVIVDEEEKELLKEVAGDIAVARHAMEVDEERKRAEEELKQTAILLQEHVEKLEEAKRQVEEACSLREHFLKETSHRIITPVAIIGGCVQLLLESRNLDEDQKKRIRIMQARNAEVQKLVRDALAGRYLEEGEE